MSRSEKPSPAVILCVDDDPTAVMVRGMVLESAGYEVIPASDCEDALRKFSVLNVDLVISDHFLRGVTGAEISLKMKALKPEVPILLISGLPERPEGANHVDAFIAKGGAPRDMLAVVARLLARRGEDTQSRAAAT